MPELPDVEVFRRYIDATSLHKTIKNVSITNPKILENLSQKKLSTALVDTQFEKTKRQGKYLFVKTNNNTWLILHFGMTGFVSFFKSIDKKPDHTRLLITFDNEYHLAFDNQRLLGTVGLTKHINSYIDDKNLGIDALDVSFEAFMDLYHKRKAMIKTLLMNQSVIAGVGNIYADEILFQSQIHPKTETHRLSEKQKRTIYQNMNDVLEIAIDKKADPSAFPESFIIPNRKKDGKCPIDGNTLETIKVNGRTTYYCPSHQKKQ